MRLAEIATGLTMIAMWATSGAAVVGGVDERVSATKEVDTLEASSWRGEQTCEETRRRRDSIMIADSVMLTADTTREETQRDKIAEETMELADRVVLAGVDTLEMRSDTIGDARYVRMAVDSIFRRLTYDTWHVEERIETWRIGERLQIEREHETRSGLVTMDSAWMECVTTTADTIVTRERWTAVDTLIVGQDTTVEMHEKERVDTLTSTGYETTRDTVVTRDTTWTVATMRDTTWVETERDTTTRDTTMTAAGQRIEYDTIVERRQVWPRIEHMREQMGEGSLPMVNLIVDTSELSDEFTTGEVEIIDQEQRTEAGATEVRYRCQMRYRGATSKAYAKKSFALKLTDTEGEDLDANILGIREENSWILDAMAIDRSRMRNRVLFDIWNEMDRTPYETKYGGRNGTEGRYVEVYINGEYQGLYCLSDKIDRKLLGLKKTKVDDTTGGYTLRGLLYKCVSWSYGSTLVNYWTVGVDYNSTSWNSYELQYPSDYACAAAWQPLKDLIYYSGNCSEHYSDSVTYSYRYKTDEVLASTLESHFYKENLADYACLLMMFNIRDNSYKNTYFSLTDKSAGVTTFLITPWDMDCSLGGGFDGRYDTALIDKDKFLTGTAPYYRLYNRNIAGMRDTIDARLRRLAQTLCTADSVESRMRTYEKELSISGAWRRETERWGGDPVPLREELGDEVDYLVEYYRKNLEALGLQGEAEDEAHDKDEDTGSDENSDEDGGESGEETGSDENSGDERGETGNGENGDEERGETGSDESSDDEAGETGKESEKEGDGGEEAEERPESARQVKKRDTAGGACYTLTGQKIEADRALGIYIQDGRLRVKTRNIK